MSSSYSRQQLETWVGTIDVPDGSKVVDIGGSQLPVKDRVKHWGASECAILDLKEPHEQKQPPRLACDINDEIVFIDADEVNEEHGGYQTMDSKYISYFDIAFCLEVSEYLWNTIEAFHNINVLLRNNALLFASFHFVYPIHQPKENDYMRYTRYGVMKILNETGFEVLEITPRFEVDSEFEANVKIKDHPKLLDWYLTQKMRPAKDYQLHNEIGYLVKARKK